MAKPRNSVLYLFDPLQQSPSGTPCRDSSPELGSSDKENDLSAGDVTMFFNRMYAAPKPHAAQPRTPKGKLIDIGDTPAPDRLWDDAEHDGSDADEEQSEGEADSSVATAVHIRMPLADLDVEDTPRPQQDARHPFQAPVFASATSPSREEQPLRALFAAPQGSPLAEVINSITFSALSLSENAAPAAEQPPLGDEDTEDRRTSSPFPEITICAPETPSVSHFDLGHDEEPAETSIPSASRLRPSSTLTQLSPDDPRRTSVDLYSSFHLQMQSDDMSFDLLNDKISFLGNGQDSFWAGGEDTMFDFDEENKIPAARGVQAKLAPVEEQPTEVPRCVFSPPQAAAQFIEVPLVNSPTAAAMRVPLPMSPPPSTPSPRVTVPRVLPHLIAAPPSPPTSPVSLDEPSLLLESEPLPPMMPPPVPALRITKKTFKMTGRVGSAPTPPLEAPRASQPAEKVEPAAKKSSPTTATFAAPAPISAPQPQPPRPNYRGVQRPPASMLAAGVVIGLPPQGSSHNTSASTSSSSSAGSSASRPARAQDGSRFAAAGIQRPTLPSKERPAVRSATAVPARSVKAVTSSSGITRAASASAAIPKASGLRPPSRIAAPGAGSTLPRPASRLPAPSASGLARQAITGASSGIGIGRRVVTAPRAPTGGRF